MKVYHPWGMKGSYVFGADIFRSRTTPVIESTINAVNIYAYGNKIVVENAMDEIFVYNAMGALICRDAINRVRTEIPVNVPGVYIVKTGGTVKRVLVN